MYLVLKITKLHHVDICYWRRIFQKSLFGWKTLNDLKYNHMVIGCKMSLKNDTGLWNPWKNKHFNRQKTEKIDMKYGALITKLKCCS